MARITVEDCLAKEGNRFNLVVMASIRAKQILEGAPRLVETKSNKSIVTALREIAKGLVDFEEEVQSEDSEEILEFGVEAFSLEDLPSIDEDTVSNEPSEAKGLEISDSDKTATLDVASVGQLQAEPELSALAEVRPLPPQAVEQEESSEASDKSKEVVE